MVVAGPGTGKTQVLVPRGAYILSQTDTNPQSILALTFTDSAARNMKERLVSMIGQTGYYVQISTFHAFCQEVIATHPEFFAIDRHSQPLTETEKFQLFESIVLELKLQVLKPLNQPLFYLPEMMSAISALKKEGVTTDDYVQLVKNWADRDDQPGLSKSKTGQAQRQKMVAKNQELGEIYRLYQQRLRQNLRYDFDDMIALVVAAFR